MARTTSNHWFSYWQFCLYCVGVIIPGDDASSAVITACVLDFGCEGPLFPEDPETSLVGGAAFPTATIAADEHPTTGSPFPSTGDIVMT
jgi:hypothetical protein